MQESCREALKEFVVQYKDQIKAEVQKQLRSKKGMDKFSSALIDGLVKATMDSWRLSTEFKFNAPKD